LKDKGVPVILLDTRINTDALKQAGLQIDSFIGSSNRQGGKLAADVLMSKLPSGGTVLLLNGVEGHETAAERRIGFLEELNELSKEKNVTFQVTQRTCNWSRSEALSTVDAFLALGRTFEGIFAANDEMALGALEALRQHSTSKAPNAVIGFDATNEARRAVTEGRLTATIAQDPYSMGVKGVETLNALWEGKKVEADVVIPVQVIGK
jgi:ribose transport system substrate-binding protein